MFGSRTVVVRLSILIALFPALLFLQADPLIASAPEGSVAAAKLQGGQQTLSDKVVTAAIYQPYLMLLQYFYVEETDRSSAIQVVPDRSMIGYWLTVEPGMVVTVTGEVVGGPSEPECYLYAQSVTVTGTSDVPAPVVMSAKSMAGGAFGLQQALCKNSISVPVELGVGLNAVGMLVRASGMFWRDPLGQPVYYLDDGSGLIGSGYAEGVYLKYASGMNPVWETGDCVATTAVLGAEMIDGVNPVPVLRMDSTPPIAPSVIDEGWEVSSTNQLRAFWSGAEDPETGVESYDYAIGTAPYPEAGWDGICGWTSTGTSTQASATGLALLNGVVYYISVRAVNGAGVASVGTSDGVIISSGMEDISINQQNDPVPVYERFEAAFSVDPDWVGMAYTDYNPFNPGLTDPSGGKFWRQKGIYIDAIITRPDGTSHRWPCFYDYSRGWKLRYSPDAAGLWSYQIEARFGSYVRLSSVNTFLCVENDTGPGKRGFLTKDEDWRYFSFSNGEVFYPIGVAVQDETQIASLGANGGNWARIFRASYMFEQWTDFPDYVNDFQENKALYWDGYFDACRDAGVYVIWLCNDWTRWKSTDTTVSGYSAENSPIITVASTNKLSSSGYVWISGDTKVRYTSKDSTHLYGCGKHPEYYGGEHVNQTENPYIAEGVALSLDDSFSGARTREVFKRKLRWMMARWGYSPNLVGFDLINESQYGSDAAAFHEDMGKFVSGLESNTPVEWGSVAGAPIPQNDLDRLPHHVSGDLTSCNYKNQDVPWDSAYIGMTHYHDYGRISEDGTCLLWEWLRWTAPDGSTMNGWDRMGSTLYAPWIDAAVWADRMARAHRQSGYTKPLSWTEYGLQIVELDGDWDDWDDAYYGSASNPSIIGDKNGRHAKDWFWALIFNGISGSHWDAGWFDTAPSKWWIFKPLSNYLAGVDMRGLTQESYYTVSDPLNPTKHVLSSNANVGVYTMRGNNRTYLYVKNLTNTWYYTAGFRNYSVPTPAAQTATITIKGLDAGTYTIEKWSTVDVNLMTQIKSVETKTISAGQDITFIVSLGDTYDYDWAYKIY